MEQHRKTLSKSDFKLAMDCPTKLYYKKMKFPTQNYGNEYLELLAEGGYMVGKMATLMFPEGIDLSRIDDKDEAALVTINELTKENVTLLEAGVKYQDYIIRADILQKQGNVINLIEVKSTSWDSATMDMNNERDANKKTEYLQDVAFQTWVIRKAFPQFIVKPYLMMPDKAKTTKMDGLNGLFEIKKEELGTSNAAGFRKTDITFKGDLTELRKEDILAIVDCSSPVEKMIGSIETQALYFSQSLNPELRKIKTDINYACKNCEFHDSDKTKSGFDECWGEFAKPYPDLLNFIQLGNINRLKGNKDIINEMIKAGRVRLSDFNKSLIDPANLDKPYYNNRPWMQLTYKKEWISDSLRSKANKLTYPLHFIDFETSRMALAYHRGMHPYENVAFLWSCHTIESPGAEPVHNEWINTKDEFPNFEFAESLMDLTKKDGSILIWSHHENTILRDIRNQMEKYNYVNPKLKDWLDYIVKDEEYDGSFYDMCRWAELGYFHPSTNARTSIKVTLPAVLQEYKSKRIEKWLKEFEPGVNLYSKKGDELVSPYDLLPHIKEIDNYEVKEGTGAMRAYQDMLYGFAKKDPVKKQLLRNSLLTYCKLDTTAMLIIWEHWKG